MALIRTIVDGAVVRWLCKVRIGVLASCRGFTLLWLEDYTLKIALILNTWRAIGDKYRRFIWNNYRFEIQKLRLVVLAEEVQGLPRFWIF